MRAYLRDPPGWKKQVGYGRRWMAWRRSSFPDWGGYLGRWSRLGEEVCADGEGDRAQGKVWVYNLMLGLTAVPAPALFAAEG